MIWIWHPRGLVEWTDNIRPLLGKNSHGLVSLVEAGIIAPQKIL